ncbi:PlxyGVORF77-like protein [Hyphantria cunea granulovirus]|uniref:PlxyGVORF77-like protein n=1 Tax=Hyphantria cunea granulovirus TaxID=307448 RepID=A0AAE6D0D0_9BBAC|nr:PlxyGVORF77-like protein [Hyphantria cunea granulovirus]QBQ01636.1 PlxyGVORF77-like protein [Hyphantria cunea granulovirus]
MDVHVIQTEIIKISRREDDRISKNFICRECFLADNDYPFSKYILNRTHDVLSSNTPFQGGKRCTICHKKLYEQYVVGECKFCYCEDDWLANVYVDHPLRRIKRRATITTTVREKLACRKKLIFNC